MGAPGETRALGGGHATDRTERPNTAADAVVREPARGRGHAAGPQPQRLRGAAQRGGQRTPAAGAPETIGRVKGRHVASERAGPVPAEGGQQQLRVLAGRLRGVLAATAAGTSSGSGRAAARGAAAAQPRGERAAGGAHAQRGRAAGLRAPAGLRRRQQLGR